MIDSLNCGGAEKSLTSLLPFLAERNYSITLMIQRRNGVLEGLVPKTITKTTFPFHAHGLQRLTHAIARRWPWNKKLNHAERFWKHIGRHYPELEEQFDVAIAYQQGFPTFFIANKVKASKKICWVNCNLKDAGYHKKTCRPVYDKYNYIVSVSDIAADILSDNGYCNKDNICVINDIVNNDIILKLAEDPIYCKPADKVVFTTVARLSEEKGYELAVEAASILRDRGLDFEWNFVGEGKMRLCIERLIEENKLQDFVKLRGLQLNPYPYIKQSDIYIQPSRSEGLSITVSEAKIIRKPIIVTNFPVAYSRITDCENGLITVMSGASIADAIIRLLSDNELRDKFVCNLTKENIDNSIEESSKVITLIES